MRVLFVDDVKDTRELYSFVFKLAGFSTETAEDGIEALEAIEKSVEPYDVVVLDVEMPRLNGWETLGAIREMPQGRNLPIIMFSAHHQDLHCRAAAKGANATLDKPTPPEKVIETIRRVVERAKLQSPS